MTSRSVQSVRPGSTHSTSSAVASAGSAAPPAVPPMYWRVLRLSAVRPNGWQRATLVEGVIGVSIVLALADVASAWTIVVLPLVAMAIVKVHDYLAGVLEPARRVEPPPARAADYATFAGIPIAILLLRFVVHSDGSGRDTALIATAAVFYVVVATLVYRYLRRRGVPRSRATAIAVVTLVLSPLAGILGAGLEARRMRLAREGMTGSSGA